MTSICRNILIGKRFVDKAPLQEEWYGVMYGVEDLDPQLISGWSNPGGNADIRLPGKNEFIPHSFELVTLESEHTKSPRIIKVRL